MTRRRKKHRRDQIVAKLREADAMLNAGKDLTTLRRSAIQTLPRSMPCQ
jgi:hypothetical protein